MHVSAVLNSHPSTDQHGSDSRIAREVTITSPFRIDTNMSKALLMSVDEEH